MSNNNSFGGKLRKVLASVCSLFVGASGVSQAGKVVNDGQLDHYYSCMDVDLKGDKDRLNKLHKGLVEYKFGGIGVSATKDRSGMSFNKDDGKKNSSIGILFSANNKSEVQTVRFVLKVTEYGKNQVDRHIVDKNEGGLSREDSFLELNASDFAYVLSQFESSEEFKKFVSEDDIAKKITETYKKNPDYCKKLEAFHRKDHPGPYFFDYYIAGRFIAGGNTRLLDGLEDKVVLEFRRGLLARLFCYTFGLDMKLADDYGGKLLDAIFEYDPKPTTGKLCVKLNKLTVAVQKPEYFRRAFISRWKGFNVDSKVNELNSLVESIKGTLGVEVEGDIVGKIKELNEKINFLEKEKEGWATTNADQITKLENEIKELRSALKNNKVQGDELAKMNNLLNQKSEELSKLKQSSNATEENIKSELKLAKDKYDRIEKKLKDYGKKDDSVETKLGDLLVERNDLSNELSGKYSLNQILLSNLGSILTTGGLGFVGYKAGLFGSSKSKKNSTNRANSTPNNKTTKNPRHEVKSPKKPVKRNKNAGGIKT